MARDRRDNSPFRFKAGSRPPPNTVCTYELGHVRQDVYACRKCTPAFQAIFERDEARAKSAAAAAPNGSVSHANGAGAASSANGTVAAAAAAGSAAEGGGRDIDALPDVGDVAGFCGGCRSKCHGDHLQFVVDLFSKRGFRCDCGNARMSNTCKLAPGKAPEPRAAESLNAGVYNHNFVGKYCRCDRKYDPNEGLDMLQCMVCEDWFHTFCFRMPNGNPPGQSNLGAVSFEIICASCASKTPVLEDYFAHIGLFQPERAPVPLADPAAQRRGKGCTRPTAVEKGVLRGRDLLWPQGFRCKFCRCDECMELYDRYDVAFLVDRKDFVSLQGVDDDHIIAAAPKKEDIAEEVDQERRRRIASKPAREGVRGVVVDLDDLDADDDVTEEEEDEDEDFTMRHKSLRARATRRQRAARRAKRELPAAYKAHIRKRVAEFLNSALSNPSHQPTANDVRHTLATIRAELVQGEVNPEET